MKQLILLAISLLAGLTSFSAQAATTTGNFTVTINFTSSCAVNTSTLAPVFNYTQGGTAQSFATAQSFTVTCSNLTPYTLSLDTSGGSGATAFTGTFTSPTATGTYTDTTSGLIYSLTLPATTAGTGAAQTYALTGNMAAGQTSTVASGTAIANTHTLTLTY